MTRRRLHVEMDVMIDTAVSDEEAINHLAYVTTMAFEKEGTLPAQREKIIQRLVVTREFTVRSDKTVI